MRKGGTLLTSALQRAVLRDEDVDKAHKWLWQVLHETKQGETTRLEGFKKGFERNRGEQWLGHRRAGLMTREEVTDLLRAVRQSAEGRRRAGRRRDVFLASLDALVTWLEEVDPSTLGFKVSNGPAAEEGRAGGGGMCEAGGSAAEGPVAQASRRLKRGRASAGASIDNANEQQRQDDEEEEEAARNCLYGAYFSLKRLVLAVDFPLPSDLIYLWLVGGGNPESIRIDPPKDAGPLPALPSSWLTVPQDNHHHQQRARLTERSMWQFGPRDLGLVLEIHNTPYFEGWAGLALMTGSGEPGLPMLQHLAQQQQQPPLAVYFERSSASEDVLVASDTLYLNGNAAHLIRLPAQGGAFTLRFEEMLEEAEELEVETVVKGSNYMEDEDEDPVVWRAAGGVMARAGSGVGIKHPAVGRPDTSFRLGDVVVLGDTRLVVDRFDAGWANMPAHRNQDRVGITRRLAWEGEGWDLGPLSVFGVYDGHCEGGELVAEAVRDGIQQEARRALEDELKKLKQQEKAKQGWSGALVESLVPALSAAFRRVDASILKDPRVGDGGSTATVCFILGNRLVVANVGDSRTLLAGSDGSLLLVTEDHKVEDETEEHRIRAAGGSVDEGYASATGASYGLALSRSFGDASFKKKGEKEGADDSPRDTVVIAEPDFKTGELGPDAAFLLLASDGLFDVMGSGTATRLAHDLLLENHSATITAQFIVRYAAQQRNMLKPAGNGKSPMVRGVVPLHGRLDESAYGHINKCGCRPNLHLPQSPAMLKFQQQQQAKQQAQQEARSLHPDDITVVIVVLHPFWDEKSQES